MSYLVPERGTGADQIDFSQYPALKDEDKEFKQQISYFIPRLAILSEEQKKKLALFKAIELTNAILQIREKKNPLGGVGKEKADRSFQIVRAAIRMRQVALPGQQPICLKEPELKAIIDEACQTFHAGKRDSQQWERAMAFSAAQSIVLNEYLEKGLEQFHQSYPDLYSPEIRQIVKERFILPYRRPILSHKEVSSNGVTELSTRC